MKQQHFQLYQNPRAGSWLGSDGKRQIVTVLGVFIDDARSTHPVILYLVTGQNSDVAGARPRLVPGDSIEIAVGAPQR